MAQVKKDAEAAGGDPPVADGSAEAAGGDKASAVYVKCVRAQRFRAGMHFERGWTVAEATADQVAALKGDPALQVHTSQPAEHKAHEKALASEREANKKRRDEQKAALEKSQKAAVERRASVLKRIDDQRKAKAEAEKKKSGRVRGK